MKNNENEITLGDDKKWEDDWENTQHKIAIEISVNASSEK